MKGQVKIILKTPDGKIVKEVEKTNRVFDIPKQIITEMFPLTVLNSASYPTTNAASSDSYYAANFPLINALYIKDWFRSIKINDSKFEEDENQNIVDEAYYDWKIPQLTGGENATIKDSNNKRYVYKNTNYSKETTTYKKLYFIWTDCPAFTMRSISLNHYDLVSPNSDYVNCYMMYRQRQTSNNLIYKYGNFYWGGYNFSMRYYEDSSYSCCNSLCFNPKYKFNTGKNGSWASSFVYERKIDVTNSVISIYPLINNEIALFSQWNTLLHYYNQALDPNTNGYTRGINNSTNRNTASNYIRFINIVDNVNANDIKRSFALCQFQDIGCYGNGSYYYHYDTTYAPHMNIVNTKNGDYLIVYNKYNYGTTQADANKKTHTIRIYKLPTQTEYNDPSFIKYNPCVADKSTDTSVDGSKTYYTRSARNWTLIPGELIDEYHYQYTVVANPSGNPSTKDYYEVSNIGENATVIPYIETSALDDMATMVWDAAVASQLVINNNVIIGNHIITINDDNLGNVSISKVDRVIGNCVSNSANSYTSFEGRYSGKIKIIEGFEQGCCKYDNVTSSNYYTQPYNNFPVWYNATCMNLDDDIEIPEHYTLTVEYTITAN